jgi:hypothetical protein
MFIDGELDAAPNYHLGRKRVMKIKSFSELSLEGRQYKRCAATYDHILQLV